MTETGTVWESYHGETGIGRGKRDTFWSASLILLIMKESYDSFVYFQTKLLSLLYQLTSSILHILYLLHQTLYIVFLVISTTYNR